MSVGRGGRAKQSGFCVVSGNPFPETASSHLRPPRFIPPFPTNNHQPTTECEHPFAQIPRKHPKGTDAHDPSSPSSTWGTNFSRQSTVVSRQSGGGNFSLESPVSTFVGVCRRPSAVDSFTRENGAPCKKVTKRNGATLRLSVNLFRRNRKIPRENEIERNDP